MSENAIVSSKVGPGAMLTDCVMNRSSVTNVEHLHQTNIGQVTYEAEKRPCCPTCGNEVGPINRRLVCNICGSNTICEVCSAYVQQYTEYREYVIDLGWPICRDCYKEELAVAKMEIDKGRVERYMRITEEAPPVSANEVPAYEVPQQEAPAAVHEARPSSMFEEPGPIIHTNNDTKAGEYCAYIGMIAGVIGLFILGLLFGPAAIILGVAAVIRSEKKGVWAIVLGLLGIATSIVWMLMTGGLMCLL